MSDRTDETIRQITRLARSGALERAWSLLEQSGLATAGHSPRALALRARLKKDRARLASEAERGRWLTESAADYQRAADSGGGTYPLINAATLWLLAGSDKRASRLARQVLEQLDADPDEAETPYWLGATRAEALLLLGRLQEARAALLAAAAETPLAWEDRAATIGQFALICDKLGCDVAWLDPIRPPRSLQYTGIMAVAPSDAKVEAQIDDWLEAENVGFGFGALAAGADIWIAEALVRRRSELHVVLPCPVETFRAISVAAVDPAWVPRFDDLLGLAHSVDVLDTAPLPSPAAVNLTDAVSIGLAIHNAGILQSGALRLRIAGQGAPDKAAKPCPLREHVLTVGRKPGVRVKRVDEAGVARSMLRAGGTGAADVQFFDGPADAWAAAQPLIRQGEPVALDHRFVEAGGFDAPETTARLEAIAGAVEPGQALASKAFAFALLAEMPSARVASLGDIRAASGFFPVYALV